MENVNIASKTYDTLLEKVMYTGSLVTDPRQVDPILDEVREVTALQNDTTQPSQEYTRRLEMVQTRLEEYLLTKERARFFTKDTLALQIERHVQGGNSTERHATWILVLICLAAVSAMGAMLLIPSIPHSGGKNVQLAGSFAFSIVHLGAAWLFANALPSFKTQLRRAFVLICIGIAVLAAGLLLQPLTEIFGWRRYEFITIIVSAPTLIAGAFLYSGVRKYAAVMQAPSWWTSRKHIGITGFIVFVLTPFIPYFHSYVSSVLIHHTAAIIQAGASVFSVFALYTMRSISHNVADLYKPAARALTLALVASFAVSFYTYGVRVAVGVVRAGIALRIATILLIVLGILLLRAAYLFNKVSRY